MSAEPDRQHPGLYGSDGDERNEDDCPATFPAIGLECALMTGHDNGWHWDPRGADWREEPGIEPVFGGASGAWHAHSSSVMTETASRLVPALPRPSDPVIEAYGALVQERARLEYSETFGLLSPAAKERLAELRDAMTTSGEIAERARLEWLMAYGVPSPEDKARWEELRAPEVAALKAHIGRVLEDEVIRPALGLRPRSCPSCHSIGTADGGCADAWHVSATQAQ
jgi:hypothetical protein